MSWLIGYNIENHFATAFIGASKFHVYFMNLFHWDMDDSHHPQKYTEDPNRKHEKRSVSDLNTWYIIHLSLRCRLGTWAVCCIWSTKLFQLVLLFIYLFIFLQGLFSSTSFLFISDGIWQRLKKILRSVNTIQVIVWNQRCAYGPAELGLNTVMILLHYFKIIS